RFIFIMVMRTGRRHKKFRFSKKDHERVREAVRLAEAHTTSEIVPWVVPSCKKYRWVHPWMVLLGVVFATLALVGVHWLDLWSIHIQQTLFWQMSGATIGFGFSLISWVKRLWIPGHWLAAEVHQRALAGFISANLTELKARNGVLIFISLFERRVQILADTGARAVIPVEYWDARVNQVVLGVHQGQPIEALCECIAEIGKMLSEKFPETGSHKNLISDHLREK
ncbi:hypothetical protein WDW37_20295, partial [Bdellovibrionota bacterium FG-1]